MNNQLENAAVVEAEEEILDEFQCCVCLDLLYKPVVLEEEKISDQFSPQLDNCLSGSEPIKEPYIHSGVPPDSTTSSCNNVSLGPCSIVEGESESTIAPIPAKSTFEATKNVPFGQIVYCETCIISPDDKVPVCQVCLSAHPNGNPKVCLVLEHFLEEQFSEQYALRKEAASKQSASQNGSPPTCSTKAPKNASWLSALPTTDYLSMLSSRGPKVHFGVGCDYCGVCPIIGVRYKCKDCKERIGFDLCEGCYNSSSKLPGRFNQQHTPDHKLEIVPPMDITNLVHLVLEVEQSEEDMEEVPPAPILPGDSPHDPEDGSADPSFVDQECTHSSI